MGKFVFIYILPLVLALFLGFSLATPSDGTAFMAVFGVLALFALPFLLRHYHTTAILCWHFAAIVFVLPGKPPIWIVAALIALVVGILHRAMDKNTRILNVPSITWPLLTLGAIILITARLTGGVGFGVFSSSLYGGKRYAYLFGAILGYFAISFRALSVEKAKLYGPLFFFTEVSSIISSLLAFMPSSLYFIYFIFPVETGGLEIVGNEIVTATDMLRHNGLIFACLAFFGFLLARYGLRGVLQVRHSWRWVMCLGALVVSFFGGFRSVVILFALVVFYQFWFEGLFRTRYFAMAILALFLAAVTIVPFANHLPLSMQRTLSFLPLNVDAVARYDAQSSTEWRLDMWRAVLGEVPRYLIKGKGFAIDPTDVHMSQELARRALYKNNYEGFIASGEYHNGPLSVIVPLGIFGTAAFLWFIAASLRALYLNYRHGDPELRNLNTFLLTYFCARVTFFLVFFGAFANDLFLFTGAVALSISVNGGIRRPREAAQFRPAIIEKTRELVPVSALSQG
jgi:hypothetical protein